MNELCDQLSLTIARAVVTQQHYDQAVKTIQGAHNDAIGAPKVYYVYAILILFEEFIICELYKFRIFSIISVNVRRMRVCVCVCVCVRP